MAKIPDSTRSSLQQRLAARAAERWPQITQINTRFRAHFAYVDAVLPDGQVLPLCRLRHGGYANMWGFAIYRASHQDYQAPTCPPATAPEVPRTPWTPPAASTWPTPPPGPKPPTN